MKSEIGNRKGIVSETSRNDLEMEKVVGCKKRECGNVGSVNLKMDEVSMPLLFKEASKRDSAGRRPARRGLAHESDFPRSKGYLRGAQRRTPRARPRLGVSLTAQWTSGCDISLIQRGAIVYKSCIDSEPL